MVVQFHPYGGSLIGVQSPLPASIFNRGLVGINSGRPKVVDVAHIAPASFTARSSNARTPEVIRETLVQLQPVQPVLLGGELLLDIPKGCQDDCRRKTDALHQFLERSQSDSLHFKVALYEP